jgi:two-component system, cell cycle response regulator CpdR
MARVVLVVDDEPLILYFTLSMLENLGCEVVTAECGAGALERLAADGRIEVLITDVQMPGMDGYELAARAQSERPSLQVIFCSGRSNPRNGCTFIQKPFTQEDLARTMSRSTGLCQT